MRLNELGQETQMKMSLNYTSVDFEKEVTTQLRLKEKLAHLKELKHSMMEK